MYYLKLNKSIKIIFILGLLFIAIQYPRQNLLLSSYCQSGILEINYRVDNKFKIIQFEILDNQGNFVDGGELLIHDSIGTIEISKNKEYNFYTIRIKDLSNNAFAVSSNIPIVKDYECNEVYLETNEINDITLHLNDNESVILKLQFKEN